MPRKKNEHLTADDLKVLTKREWAKLMSLSWETARHLIMAGKGPPLIQLSTRRVGIRMIDAARWQEERMKTIK
jgi:hypothetical protein